MATKKILVILFFTKCMLLNFLIHSQATKNYQFIVREARYTRLCSTKSILTVNGRFPGPTLYAKKGDKIIVHVHNRSKNNITIHWHGVKQPRNPWSDGPEYITQCPIRSGGIFPQKIIFSTEEGTLWWHAHSNWDRATVHGAIIIYPRNGTKYPFPNPDREIPIILGEWWKADIYEVYKQFIRSGGPPITSDAYTINGQPGDLYPCSSADTFRLDVLHGQRILLRIINAAMDEILYFAIADHQMKIVGTDASYTKPFAANYITIGPGQTMDILLHANKFPRRYYMAARAYLSDRNVPFDNTTTTAILQYIGSHQSPTSPSLPRLPCYNDTNAFTHFTSRLRSLATGNHPIAVPRSVDQHILSTVSLNTFPCPANQPCAGPNGTRLASSMNNISFVLPQINVLEAYYYHIKGVYGTNFPKIPPLKFNFTADFLPLYLQIPKTSTQVRILEFNSNVEMVFQNTNLLSGVDHPMHLHGQSFYVVGWGFGNFDKDKDPRRYNLADPPLQNTVIVPKSGWTAIRFKAKNPGVWFMHCHLEHHLTWGMQTVFITKDGKCPEDCMLPPPLDMPPC